MCRIKSTALGKVYNSPCFCILRACKLGCLITAKTKQFTRRLCCFCLQLQRMDTSCKSQRRCARTSAVSHRWHLTPGFNEGLQCMSFSHGSIKKKQFCVTVRQKQNKNYIPLQGIRRADVDFIQKYGKIVKWVQVVPNFGFVGKRQNHIRLIPCCLFINTTHPDTVTLKAWDLIWLSLCSPLLFCSTWEGSTRAIIVADPDVLKEVCIKQFQFFRNRRVSWREICSIFSWELFPKTKRSRQKIFVSIAIPVRRVGRVSSSKILDKTSRCKMEASPKFDESYVLHCQVETGVYLSVWGVSHPPPNPWCSPCEFGVQFHLHSEEIGFMSSFLLFPEM